MEQESKIYRLEEMLESMVASLENIQKICEQQEKLITLVEEHSKDEFEEFIKESKEQLDNLKKQYDQLSSKKNSLEKIINSAKKDKTKENFLNLILDTLINF